MSTVQDIANQLRATNFEHARCVIEPDDAMVLIDYLEGQGFVSAEDQAVLDAEKVEKELAAEAEKPAAKKAAKPKAAKKGKK